MPHQEFDNTSSQTKPKATYELTSLAMSFLTLKLLHLVSLSALISASLYKNWKVNPSQISYADIKDLLIADKISGVAAACILASGIGMILIDYPTHFFRLQQTIFWIKMALLTTASLLIISTKIFLRKMSEVDAGHAILIPKYIKIIFRIDLFSLLIMIMLAMMMVRI